MIRNKEEICRSSLFLSGTQNQINMKIAVAKGDGIGPEIMEAVLSIFTASKVPLEYSYVEMGKWVFDKGFSNGMTSQPSMIIRITFLDITNIGC